MRIGQPLCRSTILVVGTAAAVAGCAPRPAMAPAPAPAVSLPALLDSIIAQPPRHRTQWGIHVVDAATGAVLYTRNAEQLFIPASNTKLVVGAVALARLGESYRYRTRLLAAAIADSVPFLLLAASGDPTWSARFYTAATDPLDSLATAISRRGIRAAGELVVDATRFRDALVHPAWEVGDLPYGYAPPVDAFAIAEGTFRVVVRAGDRVGAPGTAHVIGPVPQPMRAAVVTDTARAAGTLSVDYTARRDTVLLRATVRLNGADTMTLAVTNPAASAALALADALTRAGVRTGGTRVIRDSAEAFALRAAVVSDVAYLDSPPLRDIVAAIQRPSQNWIAEQVLKTIGAEAGDGSWRGGIAVEREFLVRDVAIDSTAFLLRDASGLSVQNLLTPAATVALLSYARAQTWGETYRTALAAPGLAGSTLAGRLRPLDGRLFAKTGTVTNVNTLSGYLFADDGRELIFSIATNASGQPAAVLRTAIDDVVLAIARFAQQR